jgi:sugar lactone lactonase YvrE
MYGRRRMFNTSAAAALFLLLLTSCAQPPPEGPRPPREGIVWPPTPARPRIEFRGSFSGPEDLGIKRGFLRRVREVFTGVSRPRLIRPMTVVVNVNGEIFVGDPGSNGVHRFNLKEGGYDLVLGPRGSPLPSPVALTGAPEGEVYVVDSILDQVLVIRPGSRFASPLNLKAELKQPTSVAVDPVTKRLYVVDAGSHAIKVFKPDGTLYSEFGGRGRGNGQFNYPICIWLNGDRLFVTDALNFRVQIFDLEGRFISKFGRIGDATGYFARPKGVSTDSFGHVYVVDSLLHAVQIFDQRGRFLLSFGSQGSGPGEFWLPTGIFIGRDDMIYIADSHNRRIQIFRYIGGGP